jgi:hypothetical protein
VNFIIATLPEPDSPALRSEFDNDLGAIISAADDDGYTLDRFDLPWEESASTKDASSAQSPSEWDLTGPSISERTLLAFKSKEVPSRWETQPGLILFRPDEKGSRKPLLLLFLVGETPTRGITTEAMRDALEQIAWLWAPYSGKPSYLQSLVSSPGFPVLNIIGPSFSGSAASIRNELESWRDEFQNEYLTSDPSAIKDYERVIDSSDPEFSISGFSTSLGSDMSHNALLYEPPKVSVQFFDGAATAIGQDELGHGCFDDANVLPGSDSTCVLHEFTMPDAERWPVVVSELQNGLTSPTPLQTSVALPAVRHPIASGTNARETTFSKPAFKASQSPRIALLSEDSAYGHGDPCDNHSCIEEGPYRDPFTVLPFPLQISDLRTAFSGEKPNRLAPGPVLTLQDAPEADESGQKREDVPPNFSARSASYDQLMLKGVLSNIPNDEIPYVGIMSSDVSDLIFLAGEIHENSPDSILFTLSSDLQLLREAVNPDLYGMLVFSSYPLFPGNEQWTTREPVRRLRAFPSEASEGIYYAALSAIEASKRARVVDPHRQILWTSVVGRDKLWPLSFAPSSALPGLVPRCSLSFFLLFVILSLFCGASALVCVAPPTRFANLRPQWVSHLTDPVGELEFRDVEATKRQYVATLLIGLFVAFLIASNYLWLPWNDWTGYELFKVNSLFWTSLSLIILLGLLLIAVVHRIAQLELSTASFVRLLFSIGILLLAINFCYRISNTDQNYKALIFMRSTTLGSGVSPLKVLIFVGIAALALSYCHLQQVTLLEDCALPKGGFLGFDNSSFHSACEHERNIMVLLEVAPWKLPGARLLTMFVLLQTLFFCWKAWWFRFTLDGPAFGWFWVIAATIIYGGLFFLLLRFMNVWRELQCLLRSLYAHPTRGCYGAMRTNRLPEISNLRLRLLSPLHDTSSVEYCLERARELLALARESRQSEIADAIVNSPLSMMIRSCEVQLDIFQRSASDWISVARNELVLQGLMAKLSSVLTGSFIAVWRLRLATRVPPEMMGTSDEHKLVEQAEYFIASRVLDFLRRVYPQLINLIVLGVAGVLALMLASSTYPMPASNTLLSLTWFALLVAVGISLWIFVRMNMNSVISLLQGTSPGHFNFTSSFALQLLFVGVLPIMTMLGAQFPHSLGQIVSWVSGIFSHPSGS